MFPVVLVAQMHISMVMLHVVEQGWPTHAENQQQMLSGRVTKDGGSQNLRQVALHQRQTIKELMIDPRLCAIS